MTPYCDRLRYCHEQDRSILDIALSVHMVITGVSDFYQDYFKDVSVLLHALKYWRCNTNVKTQKFDLKVYELVECVVDSHKMFVKKMGLEEEAEVLKDERYFLV